MISVSDKSGLDQVAAFLVKYNVTILSTGGTAKFLRAIPGANVIDVSEATGFPEIQDGRVKTLHPKIHGALLGVRGNPKHEDEMKTHGIEPIDLVIVNLYPFEKTVTSGSDFALCVENIDIGGPSMIRSSAKNHSAVAVVTGVEQYSELISHLEGNRCGTSLSFRRKLAAAAFEKTAKYDTEIAAFFARETR